jgi:hypothetical protein
MEYETTHTKSSGVAKAGLTLGIIGTSIAGLLAANNGGLGGIGLGNLFGGGNRAVEETQQSKISNLEACIAELKSMRYTDAVGIDLYKNIVETAKEEDAKIAKVQSDLIGYVIDLDKRTALNAQAAELNRAYDTMARDYQMTILNNKIDCCCEKAGMQAAFDRELTAIADASILSYVNSNFLPGTLKLPITSICPTPATATAA